jgi:hypothetical protein
MPTIDPSTVCFIIVKAREFDEKVRPEDPNPGSNPSDDRSVEILESHAGDPTWQELVSALEDLNEDELDVVHALALVGRGDFDKAEWEEAVGQVREARAPNTAEQLARTPMLGDLLEEGLTAFGYSCEDEVKGRL